MTVKTHPKTTLASALATPPVSQRRMRRPWITIVTTNARRPPSVVVKGGRDPLPQRRGKPVQDRSEAEFETVQWR